MAVFDILTISDPTTMDQILESIDHRLLKSGTGSPIGVVLGRTVGQYYYDLTSKKLYICIATNGTVGGTTWQLVSPSYGELTSLLFDSPVGWNYSYSGADPSQPDSITYSQGTERYRVTLTWGTTGGEDGNITQAVFEYSSNSGGSYSSVGTVVFTFNAGGDLLSSNWS